MCATSFFPERAVRVLSGGVVGVGFGHGPQTSLLEPHLIIALPVLEVLADLHVVPAWQAAIEFIMNHGKDAGWPQWIEFTYG